MTRERDGVVTLLRDDVLGARREGASPEMYLETFDAMTAERGNHLIVGEVAGRVVATYQITFISGLSLRAAWRANVESVRVASNMRRRGIGAAMLAEARARAAGCTLIQLAMNVSRTGSKAFYEAHDFTASHHGFKRPL